MTKLVFEILIDCSRHSEVLLYRNISCIRCAAKTVEPITFLIIESSRVIAKEGGIGQFCHLPPPS